MDATTDRYAKGFSDMAPIYVDLTHQATRLLDLAALTGGERVLDVGCGPGTVTRIAAERVGTTGRVVGVDLAPNMLERAREHTAGLPNVEIVAMDAIELTFDDGAFDVVVANSVVQFSGPKSLGEWRRVVRPDGGRVACSLPHGPTFWFELCQRYVHHTPGEFRETFQPRIDRAMQRLDPEAARARHGFASVTSEVEHLVRRHDSAEAAWEAEYGHGARVFLEELPPNALADFKAEYLERVLDADGHVAIDFEFHYWCFTR